MDEKLAALADEIKGLNYVIMRNWETMPPLGDIDFYVSNNDYPRLLAACVTHLGDHKWFDIRQPGDNYFPEEIGEALLFERKKFGAWWIPHPGSAMLGLMWHGWIHKGDDRYAAQIKKLFFEMMPPIKPNDEGVGYHDPN